MARQNEKEGKRPGVLIYFDIRPALEMLTLSERGELFTAILAFAEDGEIPTFAGSLGMAWAFIRPQLEADAKRYRKTVVQNTYSSYCAKEKRAERKPMDFELWLEYEGIDADWNRVVPNDTERNPNTTTNTIQKSISLPTPALESATAGAGKGSGENSPGSQPDFEQLRQQKLDMLKNMN